MEKRMNRLLYLFICFFVSVFYSVVSQANMICYNGSQYTDEQSTTFVVSIPPVALSKSAAKTVLTDMSSYARCIGYPTSVSNWKDALRSTSLAISSTLTDLGYAGYLQYDGGPENAVPASQVCLWPDSTCSPTYSFSTTVAVNKPLYAKVGLKRASGTPGWSAGKTIPVGTELAQLKTQMRYSGAWQSTWVTWSFVLASDMVVPTYTCSVTQFDESVTLPTVKRSDILRHGTGRYPDAKKEFKYNLNCEPETAVSITFDGDALNGTGTDSVLKNSQSGNDNIGIQLLFNSTTPVKLAERLLLVSSAQSTELLSFNAYYYYKGGDLNSGLVKANASFTFDYQ